MSYYFGLATICIGGQEAPAGGTRNGQTKEAETLHRSRENRGPHDRQKFLGPGVVHKP